VSKASSTPDDPGRAVVTGIHALLRAASIAPADVVASAWSPSACAAPGSRHRSATSSPAAAASAIPSSAIPKP
jgi:hypothetical protein